MNTTQPVISVTLITYNHGPYIAQSIESILEQECEVPFELVIAEDLSPDNTRAICEDYAHRYPDIIRLLPSERNWGPAHNMLRMFDAARGQFIAYCEGDDYWLDKTKLQQQLEVFRDHPSTSMVYSNSTDYWEQTGKATDSRWETEGIPLVIDLAFLIRRRWFIRSATMMFRKELIDTLPSNYDQLYSGDYFLQLYFALSGPIRRIENTKPMAMYRHHQGGVSKTTSRTHLKRMLAYLPALLRLLESDPKLSTAQAIAHHYLIQLRDITKFSIRLVLPNGLVSTIKKYRGHQ